jgi:hypothetical protein
MDGWLALAALRADNRSVALLCVSFEQLPLRAARSLKKMARMSPHQRFIVI